MSSGLEDKIIAYFDGELSDADSAELLHRTSVSPEIRNLFREHEMLREFAQQATRSVAINPEIESSLLSRIEVLAEKQSSRKAPLIFSRRTAAFAALALVLISGSLGYFIPKLFSNGTSQISQSIIGNTENISASVLPSVAAIAETKNSFRSNISDQKNTSSLFSRRIESHSIGILDVRDHVNELPIDRSTSNNTEISLAQSIPVIGDISSTALREEKNHSDIGNEKRSPFEFLNSQEEVRSLFELSLQTSSGFTYPADATPITPFADQRLSFAYHITENNLIGLRLGSGLYQQLGAVNRTQENGVEVLRRNIETKRSFSEEVFLSHLVPIYFSSPFSLEFSIGGGFIPNGFTFGAEAGIRIPVSENFLFDFAFALSRVHSNALSSQAILASETTTMQPILLESVDIHNTLNGRLHYGLTYRF